MINFFCVKLHGCRICGLPWRTKRDGWEANLFLCRLTLSFHSLFSSKTPTISSVCLPPLPILLHHSRRFVPYCFCIRSIALFPLPVNQAIYLDGPLCIYVWEERRMWSCGGGEKVPLCSRDAFLVGIGRNIKRDRKKNSSWIKTETTFGEKNSKNSWVIVIVYPDIILNLYGNIKVFF